MRSARPPAAWKMLSTAGHAFPSGRVYSILVLGTGERQDMAKRKPARFSATKAVKANARERVGQPPPARVVEDTPRTGRKTKHKPKLDQIIRQEE